MEDKLNNGDVPTVTAPLSASEKVSMWVRDTIHRKQKYNEYHRLYQEKGRVLSTFMQSCEIFSEYSEVLRQLHGEQLKNDTGPRFSHIK